MAETRCLLFHCLPSPFIISHTPFSNDFLPLYLPSGSRICSFFTEFLPRFSDPPLTLAVCVICHHGLSTVLSQVKSCHFSRCSSPKQTKCLMAACTHSSMSALPASYQCSWLASYYSSGCIPYLHSLLISSYYGS